MWRAARCPRRRPERLNRLSTATTSCAPSTPRRNTPRIWNTSAKKESASSDAERQNPAMSANSTNCDKCGKYLERPMPCPDCDAPSSLAAMPGSAAFEAWLRTVCFQPPTPEAYDLAKCAWVEATKRCNSNPPNAKKRKRKL